jgi:hypothetical protein
MAFEQYITIPRERFFKSVLQFKIVLIGTDPPVWRRLVVPESYTFYDFHVAIQDAMGWLDYHLHNFEVRTKKREKEMIRIECPWMTEDLEGDNWLMTTEVPLKRFIKKEGDVLLYHYDYGDGWRLEIVLEHIMPRDQNIQYPICLDGELSGPPEDCGGIHGYYKCVQVVADQDNEEGLLTWLGDWTPHDFDPSQVVFESPVERFEKAVG